MRGVDYLVKEGFVLLNGLWINFECIVFFVVIEVINYFGVVMNF